ncbi:MAG: site-specific DNA-methyltransferase [Desulfovibrionaceae bacterium]
MTKLSIIYVNRKDITPYKNNPRIHDEKHINQIVSSIKTFDFTNPILLDENNEILAAHGRFLAAQHLQIESLPCVILPHLTEAQKKTYRIADNKLTINGAWDENLLGLEFKDLSELELDFSLDVTGFSIPEIDLKIQNLIVENQDPLDEIQEIDEVNIIAQAGDIWQLGEHIIFCGNSLDANSFNKLMEDKKARMIFTDAPYNVKITGHVCGSGKIQHDEFAMASGEMSEEEFTLFLQSVFTHLRNYSLDGSLHYLCMDWRHIIEITSACKNIYTEMKNLCVWNKASGGMGSLYRSKHELVFIYKNGEAPHINNIELGKHGRYRTNVWDYAGVNSFGKNKSDLELHPTVKPVEMIADAIMDTTHRNDIVLDAFLGSGSTLLACEKTGRVCRGIELEPKYIDVTIKRWQKMTGKDAIHIKLNKGYADIMNGGRND